MLPELILAEERSDNLIVLLLLGFISACVGIMAANILFPSEAALISVIFAAIPLVYPLMQKFFEDEQEGRVWVDDLEIYFSLFMGQVAAFYIAGILFTDLFTLQIQVFAEQLDMMQITGYAVANSNFMAILMNNLIVFSMILGASTIIGSSGAFILSWNGSVLGVFLAILTKNIEDLTNVFQCSRPNPATSDIVNLTPFSPSPLCYLPHASLEMAGFIMAGILGTFVSASIYERDFDRTMWRKYGLMGGLGISLILAGAGLETGYISVFGFGIVTTLLFVLLWVESEK